MSGAQATRNFSSSLRDIAQSSVPATLKKRGIWPNLDFLPCQFKLTYFPFKPKNGKIEKKRQKVVKMSDFGDPDFLRFEILAAKIFLARDFLAEAEVAKIFKTSRELSNSKNYKIPSPPDSQIRDLLTLRPSLQPPARFHEIWKTRQILRSLQLRLELLPPPLQPPRKTWISRNQPILRASHQRFRARI